jgi:hypothetical protein
MPMRHTPVGCTLTRCTAVKYTCEIPDHEMHTSEIYACACDTLMRCTSVKCTLIRCITIRHVPRVRISLIGMHLLQACAEWVGFVILIFRKFSFVPKLPYVSLSVLAACDAAFCYLRTRARQPVFGFSCLPSPPVPSLCLLISVWTESGGCVEDKGRIVPVPNRPSGLHRRRINQSISGLSARE